jgi:hypothetical protein
MAGKQGAEPISVSMALLAEIRDLVAACLRTAPEPPVPA